VLHRSGSTPGHESQLAFAREIGLSEMDDPFRAKESGAADRRRQKRLGEQVGNTAHNPEEISSPG
jgi:hypothetical protein